MVGNEILTEDQDYLDEAFDRLVAQTEEGLTADPEGLLAERPDLRPQIEELARLAQRVAVGSARQFPKISGYTILSELGRGGMGVVYLAQQEKLGGRLVAIKVLLQGAWASSQQRRRFEREADLVAALRHPNIVRVYDSGVTGDAHPYYVMEYVEGTNLDDWVAGLPPAALPEADDPNAPLDRQPSPDACAPITVQTKVQLIAKIAEAVGYAHQRGTIHRDLKPGNIRMDPAGDPHVLDFGLAKLASKDQGHEFSMRMSQTGEFIGTLPWASPEQVAGEPDRIDVRTDVYSIGVIAFQLLTGQFPYQTTGSFPLVLSNIQHTEAPRPSTLHSGIDDEIDTIVLKCLAKDPDRRYQTAGELARDLRHYLAGEPIEAKRDSVTYLLRKQMRRYRVSATVAVVLLIVTSSATLISRSYERRAARDRDEARHQAAVARAINEFVLETLGMPDPFGNRLAESALRDVKLVDALETASKKVNTAFPDEPAVEAGVRATLGLTYVHLGMLNEAEPHLTRALELRRKLLGDDHPDTLTSVAHLGELRMDQGSLEEAASLWQEAWDGRRAILGEEHPDTLTAKDYTAQLLMYEMRFDEAEPLMRECIAARSQILGPEHRETLHTTNNLAVLLSFRGHFVEAEELFREVHRCYQRDLGEEHSYTTNVRCNIATMCELQGKYEEAVALNRSAFEAKLRSSGPEHTNTVTVQCKLGETLVHVGQLEEAEPLITGALALKREIQGDENWETLSVQAILAELRYAQGELNTAEALLSETLAVERRIHGEDHFRVLRTMTRLGRVWVTLGRVDDAVSLLSDALRLARESDQGEHPQTLATMVELARALRDDGQRAEAADLLAEALAGPWPDVTMDHPTMLSARAEQGRLALANGDVARATVVFRSVADAHQRRLGPHHANTLSAKNLLARALCEAGDHDAAVEAFSQIESAAAESLAAGHWLEGLFAGDYGRCLLKTGELPAAEKQLLSAHALLNAALGSAHHLTRQAAADLSKLYEVIGDSQQATTWQHWATAKATSSR